MAQVPYSGDVGSTAGNLALYVIDANGNFLTTIVETQIRLNILPLVVFLLLLVLVCCHLNQTFCLKISQEIECQNQMHWHPLDLTFLLLAQRLRVQLLVSQAQ